MQHHQQKFVWTSPPELATTTSNTQVMFEKIRCRVAIRCVSCILMVFSSSKRSAIFRVQEDPPQVSMTSLNMVRFSVDPCRSLYEIRRCCFPGAVSSLLILIAPCEVTWQVMQGVQDVGFIISRPRPCDQAELRKMKLQNKETSP